MLFQQLRQFPAERSGLFGIGSHSGYGGSTPTSIAVDVGKDTANRSVDKPAIP
jgi:hypothetical protein